VVLFLIWNKIIVSYVILTLKYEISFHMTFKLLSDGWLSTAWKIGNIMPIHKESSRSYAGNHRLVSLSYIIGKVMVSIIHDHLVYQMMDAQHDFVPGRSCLTELFTALERWTEKLDCGDPIDAVYLYFWKAFDSVPHKRLLLIITAYGINDKVLSWMKVFLTDRKQRVVVNRCPSAW